MTLHQKLENQKARSQSIQSLRNAWKSVLENLPEWVDDNTYRIISNIVVNLHWCCYSANCSAAYRRYEIGEKAIHG
jgi:hypothetical protein